MIIDARVRLPADLRSDLAELPDSLTAGYDAVLGLSARTAYGRAELEAALEAGGVDKAVVHAEYEHGDYADELNQSTAELVDSDAKRYLGVGTISQQPPLDIMRAVGQVAACAKLGFVGVSVAPAFFHTAIDDRRLYPVYAKMAELDLIAFVHTGINYGTTLPFANDHPMLLDQIACDFPKLRIVACHGGWPWTAEMVAVARKHPNVYIEFGGLAPKYIAAPGGGWEVMYRFMDSVLQDQVLFGTDWPAFEIGRALAEWRAMELKDTVRDKLLGGNAARLFGLD